MRTNILESAERKKIEIENMEDIRYLELFSIRLRERIEQQNILSSLCSLCKNFALPLDIGTQRTATTHDINDQGVYMLFIQEYIRKITEYEKVLQHTLMYSLLSRSLSCCWLLSPHAGGGIRSGRCWPHRHNQELSFILELYFS